MKRQQDKEDTGSFSIASCCDIESSINGVPPGPLDRSGVDNVNVVKGTGFGSIYGMVLAVLSFLVAYFDYSSWCLGRVDLIVRISKF